MKQECCFHFVERHFFFGQEDPPVLDQAMLALIEQGRPPGNEGGFSFYFPKNNDEEDAGGAEKDEEEASDAEEGEEDADDEDDDDEDEVNDENDFFWLFDICTTQGGQAYHETACAQKLKTADEVKGPWPACSIELVQRRYPRCLHILMVSAAMAGVSVPDKVDIAFITHEPYAKLRLQSALLHILERRLQTFTGSRQVFTKIRQLFGHIDLD